MISPLLSHGDTLAEPDEHGLATVALTEAGLTRYRALIERQRARPDP